MIEESAQVVRADAEQVWVSVNRRSACAACSAAKGCGQKRIIDWLPSKQIEVAIANPDKLILSKGQSVVVGLEEGALLRASLLLYMTPLAGLIIFALLASFLGFSELFQILLTILGFGLGFVVTRMVAVRELALGAFEPRLVRVE